ncbi:MAG: TonB-dependent receptor [Acidobacteria bacterium]|nr:TonB-dependent receptor [Acidobacteriota bacterium]
MSRFLRTVFLTGLAAAGLFAQSFRGTISGSVVDTSGAAIPDAAVKAQNVGTGLIRETITTSAGEFIVPDLALGMYVLTITKNGFQSTSVKDVEVAVSRVTNISVKLGVAQQATLVEVSATAVTLDTTSSTLAGVVGPQMVQDLPMNGRDFRQMLKLAPGVSPTSSSVNGMRTSGNNYQIDGADNNDAFHNTSAVNQGGVSGIAGTLLPVEAIDQFAVATNASAEQGRNGGSNVNLVIKSGTNQFHGSAYYFNRNEYFAGFSPFQNPATDKKRVMRNDQWGFSVGGPIVKNKLFYFTTFEGQKAIANLSLRATHPSTAWVNDARALLTRYNVPVSSVSNNLLSFWPSRYNALPNTINNLVAGDRNDYDSYNGIGKIDYAIGASNNLSVRYFGGTGKQTAEAGVPYREYFQVAPSRMHNVAVNLTSTLSPRLVNQLLLGTNYFLQVFNDSDTSQNPIAAGLNTGVSQDGTLRGSPSLRITNFTGASATQPLGRIDTTGHITNNLSWTVGKHQLKFGGEYRRAHFDVFYDTNKRGTFNFDGTRGPWSADPAVSAPLRSLADFMAGYLTGNNGATIVRGQLQRDYRMNNIDWWVHDNVQLTSKLNVNFGVRWSYVGPLYDTDKSITAFRPGVGFRNVGSGGEDTWTKDFNNFAPRFGFAYNMRPKTVIRGSYGFFYDVPPMNFIIANTGMPNGGSAGVHANPAGPDPVFTQTRNGINITPNELIFPTNVTPTNVGAFGVSPDFRTPYVQNFNLNIQQQLSSNVILQMGYVGSRGTKLSLLRSINPVVGGRRLLADQFPTLGGVNILESIANSNYNSFQTQLRVTRVKRFTMTANYTWAKALDNGSNVRNALPANSFNLRREYGPANFDIRHIFTGFVSYDVPNWAPKFPRLGKGWQLNSLMTFHTGEPLDVLSGTNRSLTLDNRDRADLVGDPFSGVASRATPFGAIPFFNPAAFRPAATGTFGNIGRNAFYGPGFGAVDFSIFKDTPITERIKAQFRVEIFNILDRANLANPGTNVNSASALGLITATRNGANAPGIGFGEPRNAQLALKLIW